MLSSVELLDINSYSPNLFVVSGLQMLDNFPFPDESIRTERIKKVMQKMHEVSKSTLVHFEMASYIDKKLMASITEHVIPYTDSIGCNEQEIDNLASFLEFNKISFSADSNPRVARVLDQTRKVFTIINQHYFNSRSLNENVRMLSRIHVHTLAFQLILNIQDSKWKHIRSSAAKASLVAHRHVCQTNYVNPENSMLILDDSFATSLHTNETDSNLRPERVHIDKNKPVGCWKEDISIDKDNSIVVKICIAPNMICKEAKKTVGAGGNFFFNYEIFNFLTFLFVSDMISASGLSAQI